MTTEWGESELEQLGMAVFHQDYRYEGLTAIQLVERFSDREELSGVQGLKEQLETLRVDHASEDEAKHLWLSYAYASYDPARDGITYADWLRTVHCIVKEAVARRTGASGPAG